MWIRVGGSCGRCDTMAPNDYFILQSGWAGWGARPVGPFHTSIQVQTQIGDSVANSRIHTWGEIYPEEYNFINDTEEGKEGEVQLHSGKSDVIKASDAMEVKVRYWKTNMDFTEITDSCRVWVFSGDSTPINRTELLRGEGSFLLNEELTKDLTFEVKDHLDETHQVSLLHVSKGTSEVYLDIGKSELTCFFYQPKPFFPTMDKYFIEIDFRKLKSLYPTTSIEENLNMVTKKLKSVGFNAYGRLKYQDVYQFDTTKNIRSAIEGLQNLDYLFIAPFYEVPSYFMNYAYVLFDDALDETMIEGMLNLGGVQSINPADYVKDVLLWSKFSKGQAYQVIFKPEAFISLDFLKELEQLAKKEGVLSIRMNIGAPRVED